ncbi:hypothetical protein CPZ25_002200 [Eubacterium maltosivorans]|uniref:Uncharacterized protein n=2 Tax=Eubacterium maltosivorans TaxID=2041044 RepID=A0A4P9C6F3_EUBML|nr:hypothetical protein CPZ25_002200 [Eubacterium maltosivorans]
MALMTIMPLLMLLWYILILAAGWKMFEKTGEPGWKSFIPFYNEYTVYKFSWNTMLFWVNLICVVLSRWLGGSDMGILTLIAGVMSLVSVVLYIGISYKLAQSFGQGVGFTIGLMILRPVFILILGFGSADYIGPEGNRFLH